MSFPRQDFVERRLQAETIKSLDAMELKVQNQLMRLWGQTKRRLVVTIRSNYNSDFPRTTWNHTEAMLRGTLMRIHYQTKTILEQFKKEASSISKKSFAEAYWHSVLRHAWMLDQITPPSYRIAFPVRNRFKESDAANRIINSVALRQDWSARWNAWVDVYHQALNANLLQGSLNNSTAADAAEEVEATRPGTPSADLGDALERLYTSYAVGAMAEGALDVKDLNDDVVEKEIWQSRYDEDVCEICEPNLGLTMEEADDTIPAHPNCRCFWRIVPKEWADLLASGDPEEQKQFRYNDAHDLIPNSMVVDDGQGNPVGSVIVSFSRWVKDNSMAVSGMAQ